MKPTFIGIGAQKCASSWMHEMLRDHPQVSVAATKELDFFSYRFENGFRWYESQFPPRPGVLQAGEVSPSYFHEPGVVERVKAYAPEVCVLVSLRDPVERALSQHRHMVRLNLVPGDDLSFEAALASNPSYVEQGAYHRHLERWATAFGRQRLHVVLMDDIRNDGRAVVTALYRHLGIDSSHVPRGLEEPRNVSYVVRSAAAERVVRLARRAVSAVGARQLWGRLGDAGLRRLYRSANRAESAAAIPDPHPETLRALREQFRPEVERLSTLLQRDLSHWLNR